MDAMENKETEQEDTGEEYNGIVDNADDEYHRVVTHNKSKYGKKYFSVLTNINFFISFKYDRVGSAVFHIFLGWVSVPERRNVVTKLFSYVD